VLIAKYFAYLIATVVSEVRPEKVAAFWAWLLFFPLPDPNNWTD
jgi:hypothetical protein